jgi:hypothetical protein
MTTFKPGDAVQTRDGREAGIYWVGDGVIHGWHANLGGPRSAITWDENGNYLTIGFGKHCCDLLPKPQRLAGTVWLVVVHGSPAVDVSRRIETATTEEIAKSKASSWGPLGLTVAIKRISYDLADGEGLTP